MGAGLLAKTVCQSNMFQLNHRIREQARSHSFYRVGSGVNADPDADQYRRGHQPRHRRYGE